MIGGINIALYKISITDMLILWLIVCEGFQKTDKHLSSMDIESGFVVEDGNWTL